jgi:HK97 family phage prohead protease
MRSKTFPARIKLRGKDDGSEDPDTGEETSAGAAGQFEALVSVFGVKDSYGEVVMPGAFSRTLAEWEDSGDPIPVYWSHRLDDPDFNIGHVLEAKETDEGLYVKAQLDLDNAKAVATHNLLRQRRVTQFSFSFNVPAGGMQEGDNVMELTDLDLYEVGPTPVGANPATELIGVKGPRGIAYDFGGILGKAGRVLSEKNVKTIKDARSALKSADEALAAVLDAAGGSDDEKSSAGTKVTDKEPSGATSKEPETLSEAEVLAGLSIIELEGSR